MAVLHGQLRRMRDTSAGLQMLVEVGALRATRARVLREMPDLSALEQELRAVHDCLSDVEQEMRECEWRQEFGDRFIELARSMLRQTKERERLKVRINDMLSGAACRQVRHDKSRHDAQPTSVS